MQRKIMATLGALLMIFSLSQVALSQTYCDKRCKASVAAYLGGSALDVVSSLDKKEANPLARDANGFFSPAKGSALKLGVLGLTFVWQKHHPRRMFWARTILGITFGTVAVRNFSVPKGR